MSDATYVEIAKARRNWKEEHLDMYLGSGGTQGHIVDVSDIGGRKFTTTLLLQYVGRKSGNKIITPLIYGDIGGVGVHVPAYGGAEPHPALCLYVQRKKACVFHLGPHA